MTTPATDERARGVSSKADLDEVVYVLKVGAPFDRDQAGHLRLTRDRSRARRFRSDQPGEERA